MKRLQGWKVNEYGWSNWSPEILDADAKQYHYCIQEAKANESFVSAEMIWYRKPRYKKGTVQSMPERRWQQLSAKAAMSRAKRKVQMQRMDANDFDIPILCKWDWTDDSWSKEEAAWYLALEDDAWKEEKNLRSIGRSACYCPSCREYRRYNVETLYCTEQQYYEQRAEHWYR